MNELNVNVTHNITHEVNIRLSKQMKKVLQLLYGHDNYGWQQIELINAIYSEISFSRIASMSRTIKTLTKAELVTFRTEHYSEPLQCIVCNRVRYFLTEKGKTLADKVKANE